jgi:low affinity Fe/Cu permease
MAKGYMSHKLGRSETVDPACDSKNIRDRFHQFAALAARILGTGGAFAIAVLVIIVWAVTGPIFRFSDSWQLVINTGTTIVTFLMVFVIQNTQNRDARALHLKLDELLRALGSARTGLVNLEQLSEKELDKLEEEFRRLQGRAAHQNREKTEVNQQDAAAAK